MGKNPVVHLKEKCFIVLVSPLPTAGYDDSVIGKQVADDVARIHECLLPYLDAGYIFAHSAGGIAGTMAIKDQTVDEHAARGLEGGIASVIWLSAVLPVKKDMGLLEAAGGKWRGIEWFELGEHTLTFKSPIEENLCYHGLPEDVKQEAAKYRCNQNIAPFVDVITYFSQDVHKDKTYVICTEDGAVIMPIQQLYAEETGAKIIEIESGHFPFLREDPISTVVDIIVKAAEERLGQE